jgi:hypothetical protein
MTATEEKVREALATRAGTPITGAMPARARRRIRLRQAGVAAGLTSFVAAVLAVGAIVYGSVGVSNPVPGGRVDPAADGYTSPLENVPPGWPIVDIQDPSGASVPAVDDPNAEAAPIVVAAGTVDGSSFVFYAWTDRRGEQETSCLGLVGLAEPGEPTSAGPNTSYCQGPADDVLVHADLAVFGLQASPDGPMADFGFVSHRVAALAAAAGDQGFFEMPLLDGPAGWRARAFLFFPQTGAGSIEAYSQGGIGGGTVLSRSDLCSVGDAAGTCRPRIEQLYPMDATPPKGVPAPAPGAWPDVTYGGSFAPYVDHEVSASGVLDPGVVGQKTPVEWGTVQGVPWSLTAFDVRNAGAWRGDAGPDGEPGPAGEIFLGADGRFGGSGLALYSRVPWRPSDLGVTGAIFGSGPLTVYAGVVSDRVVRVEFRFDDGTVRTPDLVRGPADVDASYFVLWVPNGARGEILALSSGGSIVASSSMCAPGSVASDANAGC